MTNNPEFKLEWPMQSLSEIADAQAEVDRLSNELAANHTKLQSWFRSPHFREPSMEDVTIFAQDYLREHCDYLDNCKTNEAEDALVLSLAAEIQGVIENWFERKGR
jgi:hypothetical protein